nr:hypothetical protein BaRGS_030196 [Batillaria attramentaria]
MCTVKVAYVTIAAVFAYSFIYNSYIPFVIDLGHKCGWKRSWLDGGVAVVHQINLVLFSVVPSSAMLANNYFLVSYVVRSRRVAHDIDGTLVSKKLYRMRMTAIVLSFTFIVLFWPHQIFQVVRSRNSALRDDGRFNFWFELVLMLVCVHNATNFLLYIWSGPQFRKQARHLLCKKLSISPRTTTAIHGHTISLRPTVGTSYCTSDLL